MRQSRKQPARPNPARADSGYMPRVAVLVETSTSWGRRIHKGIHDYDRKHGGWQLFVEARGIEERLRVPTGWHCDGVIARIVDGRMAAELQALKIPVVNVSGIDLKSATFPRVHNDLHASAQLAAQHFAERGFRHFAFFSLLGLSYVATYQAAFAKAVQQVGGDLASFAAKPATGAEPDWNLDLAKLGEWLRGLPKPVAVLTWNPSSAREIIFAAKTAALLIPEEIAVLSGTDDTLLCELLPVPVSAIFVAGEQIGQQAAQLLSQLMQGRQAPANSELVAPLGIVTRQSTNTLAVQSPALVKALNFIRNHSAPALRVNDVARHAGLSRRVLERLFQETLGRAPAMEIRRVHLDRAKELLLQTRLRVPEVAEAAGFGSPEYFAYAFREKFGVSPQQFRNLRRGNLRG